jgi:formylmethanofuran dehydrogenase subunit D
VSIEEVHMRTIEANLNDRTRDHCIRLPLSQRKLLELCIRAGDNVRLTGEDMEVEARVEFRPGGAVAKPEWSTLVYVD